MLSRKKPLACVAVSNWYSRTSTTSVPPEEIQHCTAPLVKLYCWSMSLRALASVLSWAAWSMDRLRSVPSGVGHGRDPLGAAIRRFRRSPVCRAPVGLGEAPSVGLGEAAPPELVAVGTGGVVPFAAGVSALPLLRKIANPI